MKKAVWWFQIKVISPVAATLLFKTKEKFMNKQETIVHPIEPLYDTESRILILGSFPSVKSREAAFFYGHPQNRFWKVLAGVLSQPIPLTVEEKKNFLHEQHIALWDVIRQCEITGSSDSSIKNVIPQDLSVILQNSKVETVFCNGATSMKYYEKYQEKMTGIKAVKLPSTSPANAAFSLERLQREWSIICRPLQAATAGIGEVLLKWYDYNARILPWRSDPTPYHVWISEIMLQQTRVEAVKKYYDRWMNRLPDIPALAAASEEELLKLWEGLGYYNRVRNIQTAALTVMENYNGKLPGDYKELCKLKGIGEYTAGAIASIAFGLPEVAVDGNALRVFSRLLAYEEEIQSVSAKKKISRELKRVLPEDRAGDFNQALMDLGAGICLPNGAPLCEQCPWESVCQARKQDRVLDFPVKAKKKDRKKMKLAVFVIETPKGFVLHKRGAKGLLANLWEFPNLEGSWSVENISDALASWGIREYDPADICKFKEYKHIFTHVEWQMTGFHLFVKELPEAVCKAQGWEIIDKNRIEEDYALPSAFVPFKPWNGKENL